MSHFLVTGGCGFIGSHLVDELIGLGHEVRILDNLSTGNRKNIVHDVEVIEGDIVDVDTVARAVTGMDGVFHLAAISSVPQTTIKWRECHAINLTGTINVFDAVARLPAGPIPVVYASSAAVYGECQADRLDETLIAAPLSAYGADKRGCELHARVAKLIHGVPTIGLRIFNVYGPRQDPLSNYAGVISIFADCVRHKLPLDIYGDGQQVRDFVFVGDVVKSFVFAMEKDEASGNVFNVCTGQGTSIVELAQIICELGHAKSQLRFKPRRSGDICHSIGNPNLAFQFLGWHATTTIREGLALTLESV